MTTDHERMEFVHQCSFCGFGRAAATPVMLPPGCPECGCALDALSREAVERAALDAGASRDSGAAVPALARVLVALFALALLLAAARYGLSAGGPAGALIAVGMAGFLLLPFAPESIAPGSRR